LNAEPPPGIMVAMKSGENTPTASGQEKPGAARRKPRAAKRALKARPTPPPPPGPDVPYWIPRDSSWDSLQPSTRQAANQILAPAYRQLVLEAQGEVERSVGITLVHLMWLEICGQIYMADIIGHETSVFAVVTDPAAAIERHLHLVAAKCQTAELLSKVRMVGEMLRRGATPAAGAACLPAPAAGPIVTVPAQPVLPADGVPWPPAGTLADGPEPASPHFSG
jgi:hypothetical protein